MSAAPWHLPGFTELGELGTGSQGRVVLARHEAGGGQVAIKYLAPDLLGDTFARDTFRSEAALLTRVVDPNVARLYEYVETPRGAAIVLEAVPGGSLRELLDEGDGPMPVEAALATLKGSLLGLAAAHAAGVVHRDYKPANVLVQGDGRSKLIDFGIAVLAGQGGVGGTPPYMAPEQWSGRPASSATDIYAATCVFFECATGAQPYRGDTVESLRDQHATAPVPVHLVPEPLRPLVARGLAKTQTERFADARAFVAELEAAATSAYGPDWERRGVIALAGVAAVLATAVPIVSLGGAILAPAAASAGAGAGAGALTGAATGGAAAGNSSLALGQAAADAAGHAGTAASKGFLAKAGGAKGVAAIAGTGAAAAVAAGVLVWPSDPDVGGVNHGVLRASFSRPGVLLGQPHMPPSETPYMSLDITVRPARATPGTAVTVTTRFRARNPLGATWLPGGARRCFGEKSKRPDVRYSYGYTVGGDTESTLPKGKGIIGFYRASRANSRALPAGPTEHIVADSEITGAAQPYVASECAHMSRWTDTRTFPLPGRELLRPGAYLVTPAIPPRLSSIRRDGAEVAPEAVGAVTVGTLPTLTVLDG
ncbi:serine/threonine-protein kinase [Actinomadura xylanilytica]|uniref:serine/threonine-protein kinase n=1 Tax=Actinomadura xylanilytica TaxID=887459 RepID=UPI00255ADAF0|nr:serine/threonine-protein kinase [Actinomadura xylanilytica]MDL4772158.1 serine/threonine-protein kinase [Actinomadura xylanilytica]